MARAGFWLLRILLAVAFVFFGLMKFGGGNSMWVRIFDSIGFGQWFRYFTGAVEVAGGLLALIPQATPLMVILLVPTILGALLTHVLLIGLQPASVILVVLFLLVLAIARHYRRLPGA
jgi:putative oxidoreductase